MSKPTKRTSPSSQVRRKKTKSQSFVTTPTLWTKQKNVKTKKEQGSFLGYFASVIGKGIAFGGQLIGVLLKTIGTFFLRIITRNKITIVISALMVVVAIGALWDWGVTNDKIYTGIKVGEVEVGGKSIEEAQKLIEDTYAPRLPHAKVYIFANEEARNTFKEDVFRSPDESFIEQQSLEEARAQNFAWETDAASLKTTLDTEGLVNEAFSYGRSNGGLLARLGACFSEQIIDPRNRYDEATLEAFIHEIDVSIGDPRVDYDVEIHEGTARITKGHDGYMVDRLSFRHDLDAAFLTSSGVATFVTMAPYAPLRITEKEAQKISDRINASIIFGARLVYDNTEWALTSNELGEWVKTKVETHDKGATLVPYLDYDLAKSKIYTHFKVRFEEEASIEFLRNEQDSIRVQTGAEGIIPHVQEAVTLLNTLFFEEAEAPLQQPTITVNAVPLPDSLTFEEALYYGLITRVGDYTTEYAMGAKNRNHNIHLVSDLLNNSIIEAKGGVWSFNATAGNCNEEAGFKGAGSIVDGEFVDEIGGGICQVATTVFNAVYGAGYPIVQRSNHSLYIASYPAGRDAAVSWPDVDLKWKNDTSSDIILTVEYTDTSVSVALYGTNPEYFVTTTTGEWEEGDPYKTKTTVDETLTPGSSSVKVKGCNGSNISIVRTVKDSFGAILHKDTFASRYIPKDEVIVKGPEKENDNSDTPVSSTPT